jgi:elongation factor P
MVCAISLPVAENDNKERNTGKMVAIGAQKVTNGMKLEHRNDVWSVVEARHHKPGKGGAVVRLKLKSLTTGRVLEETMQASTKVEQTEVSFRKMMYLYQDGPDYVFMDNENFEQLTVMAESIGDSAPFLMENMEASILIWDGDVLSVELPAKVDLKVTSTMNADKGNTATNVTKDATLESGYVAQVPLFINEGDVVRIDTRDGSYESRVN